MKRIYSLLLVATMLSVSFAAQAGNTTQSGWYAGGGAMGVLQSDADSKVDGITNIIEYDLGWGVSGSGGYAWGNGIRTEGEVSFRDSGVDSVSGAGAGPNNGGTIRNVSFMGNVLYDFAIGTNLTPYLGVGLGTSLVNADDIKTVNFRTLDSDRMKFAYQAIAGVSMDLKNNWALTADYRYFRTIDPQFKSNMGDRATTENASHNIMLGLRYLFADVAEPIPPAPLPMPAQAMPAPMPAAPQVARPMVAPVPQSYMVFFDFDKSTLTPEAKRIIASAASDFKSGRYVRIVVTGHTDTMGTVRYNQKLSERRASAVKSEFARLGVTSDQVMTVGAGKSSLLVPTSDHVREAQNRRAEIVFNK